MEHDDAEIPQEEEDILQEEEEVPQEEEQAQERDVPQPPEAADGVPEEEEEELPRPEEAEANADGPQQRVPPAAAAAGVPMEAFPGVATLMDMARIWLAHQERHQERVDVQEKLETMFPGSIHGDGLLNYHKKADMALFHQGSAPLPTRFDVTSSRLHPFLNELLERGDLCGWGNQANPEQSIFIFANDAGAWTNVLREYGKLPMQLIRNEAQRWLGEKNRKVQNNIMAVTCIRASLTPGARDRLRPHKNLFTVSNDKEQMEIAPLLVKTLVDMATSSSRATNQAIRDMMRGGANIMMNCKQDISRVNVTFTNIIDQILARNMSMDESIDNVATCYLSCKDEAFVRYMSNKYEAYCDGTLDCDVFAFMDYALAFYNTRTTRGKWLAKNAQSHKIVSLSSQVDDLKKKLHQAMAARAARAEVKGGLRLAESTKKPFVRRTKNKKSNNSTSLRAGQKRDEQWMKQPPASGEPESKLMNGKIFHWCIHHMCWTIHRPEDCRLGHQHQAAQRNNRGHPMANNATATSSEMNYLARVAEVARDW